MFRESEEIGPYTLIRKLGRGGFGEVWLAEKHSQFVTKKVAVKLPHDEQVNFDTIHQEATLWEQASGHANVLPIIDADIYNGQVIIVSEYADGGSLADKLKSEGKFSIKQAVEMVIGILSGLQYLHSKHIIHRDIKPQNILLQGDTPRLADFGISRAMQTTSISSTIVGTDAYMSPETFEGNRSVQTDIWSVGVVLYQLLAGNLPFPQEHPTERMFAILMKDFAPLSENIPPDLQKIIKKALAKNPNERFQTALEMRDDLKDFLHTISSPVKASNQPPAIPETEPAIQQNHPLPPTNEKNIFAETVETKLRTATPQQAETLILDGKITQSESVKAKRTFPKLTIIAAFAVLLFGGILTVGYFVYQSLIEKNIQSDFKGISISKEEMEIILQDSNPMALRQLAQNPGAKKELADNVRELFAIASQAEKEGLTADVDVKRELENIGIEVQATHYDKAINKDKGSMTPFSFISEEQMNQFWARSGEEEFQKFLDSKIKIFKESDPEGKVPEITEEQKKQAREHFAKTRIYAAEAKAKEGVANNGLPADFFKKVELQTKLQKAQFLARLYSQKVLAKKLEVTDEEIEKYIKAHPELGSKEEKRLMAEKILNRVKAGEDFAKLATEFSEDPGSKDKGGLYEGITEGAFVPEFEKVAFALEPGQLHPELVESNFGYHIIKLEKKGENKGQDGQTKRTFDARHILISTTFKDPENPMGRDMPVKDYVKAKLEKEKEKRILEEIKANNPVEVAENFEVVVPPMPEQTELPPGMMPMEEEPGANKSKKP